MKRLPIVLFGLLLAARPVAAQEAVTSSHEPEPAPVPASVPAAAPAPQPATRGTVIGLRLDGGYSFRRIYQLPGSGADLGLGLAVQPWIWGAITIASRVFVGSTDNGLDLYSVKLGPEFEVVIDRVRLGTGVHLFQIGIGRALQDDTLRKFGLATFAAARIDAVQLEGITFFGRVAIDAGGAAGALWWGPTLGAGLDFDLTGDRAKLR